MKTVNKRGISGGRLIAAAALVAAIALTAATSAVSAQPVPSIKNGEACKSSELKKKSGTLVCTYVALTKKYIWTTSSAASAAAKVAVDKSKWPKKLIVGAVPSENAASMTLKYQNFVNQLSKATGLPVEFVSATDYAGIIEAQIAGRVDLAFYGPFSYVLAKARGAKIDVLGTVVKTPTTKPGYYSYGITKSTRTDVNSLKDFKGKKICFVDAASTSGYLYPNAGLLALGIDATKESTTFAGGHDASVLAINRGTCDVGFAYDDIVDTTMIAAGTLKAGEIKTVWKSGIIAGSPMAVSLSLPASLQAVIKDYVLNKANKTAFVAAGVCKDEATCQVIEDTSWGFVKYSDAEYDGVRQVCEATKSSKCK
jgi:phosphonate transport system substrate-binding protein